MRMISKTTSALLAILTAAFCTGAETPNNGLAPSRTNEVHIDVSALAAIDAGADPDRKSPPGQLKVDMTDIRYGGPYKGIIGPFSYVVSEVPDEDPYALNNAYAIALYTNGPVYVDGIVRKMVDAAMTKVMTGDLDHDGKDELIVCLHSGAWAWGSVEIYRISDKGLATRLPLSEEFYSKGGGHRGHDVFSVSNGILYAEYPIYREDDSIIDPTGGSVRYRLDLPGGKWVEVKDQALTKGSSR